MTATTPHPLSPAGSFAYRNAFDAQIAADGKRICFIHALRDTSADEKRNVLMVSNDRRNWAEVAGSEGVSVARWSPGGTRLAFLRRSDGKSALVVRDVAGGSTKVLTENAALMRELAWSPDGTRLAFQMRIDEPLPDWLGLPEIPQGAKWSPPVKVTERLVYRHDSYGEWPEGGFHVFVASADGSSAPRQVTSGVWWNGMPHLVMPGLTWSADGAEVLFTGTRNPDWDRAPSDIDIHAARIADSTVRQVTSHPGMVGRPTPSPDGRWLAYTVADEGRFSFRRRCLHVAAASGAEPRVLTADLDRSVDEVAWSADGASLLVTYDAEGRREIARVSLKGEVTPLVDDVGPNSIEMPYAGGGFSVAKDGTIAYVRSAIDLPSDVAVVPPAGKPETLTALNADLARAANGFHDAEMFWVTGGEGRKVQCWLMKPKTPGPHPMVLEIHGGPYAQYGNRFSMKYQMMAAAGYAVLFTNPCGSTGYGEAFANALHDRFPGPDYDDMMAAVDVASARPDIDAENLFVTGVSGGGVLSLWIVTHTHRFRAAVSIKPVVSWESWLLTADMGASGGLVWMGGELPWENPGKYRARSPLSFAHMAKTPTMLMAGEADSRTPPTEALQMYAAFKLAGVETALVRFPNTSHSSWVMRPSLFAAEVSCMLGWFERFRRRG